MKKLYRLCRDYVAQFEGQEKSLLFVGATGLGKTYLSTAVARALLERGKSVIYISAPELPAGSKPPALRTAIRRWSSFLLRTC